MKHVRQNKNECILASVSVITGKPYAVVRRYANLVARNVIQDQYIGIFDKGRPRCAWASVVSDVVSHFGIRPAPFTRDYRGPWVSIGKLTSARLCGRGFLFLRYPESEHVVAFENGIVFDGNQKKELTANEFRLYNVTTREKDSVVFRVCRNY